jgi:hypothetical protein
VGRGSSPEIGWRGHLTYPAGQSIGCCGQLLQACAFITHGERVHASGPTQPAPINERRPFLRAAGLAAGLSKSRLDGSDYRPLFRAARIRADVAMTPLLWARSALLVSGRDAVVSHHTAAEVLGGVVPEQSLVHVTVPHAARRPKTAGICAHVSSRELQTLDVAGATVTTAAQTFLDLSSALGLIDLVVLGDSLAKHGRCTPDDLRGAAADFSGRGAALARRAADLVRSEVDSPMESRARLLVVLAGLPEPAVNLKVIEAGRVLYRIDMGYEKVRAGLEYDGRHHAEDEAQWGHDLRRREALDARDWRLLVLRSPDIYRTPRDTLRRVVDLLTSRGMAVRMPRPGAEWERHFPGR